MAYIKRLLLAAFLGIFSANYAKAHVGDLEPNLKIRPRPVYLGHTRFLDVKCSVPVSKEDFTFVSLLVRYKRNRASNARTLFSINSMGKIHYEGDGNVTGNLSPHSGGYIRLRVRRPHRSDLGYFKCVARLLNFKHDVKKLETRYTRVVSSGTGYDHRSPHHPFSRHNPYNNHRRNRNMNRNRHRVRKFRFRGNLRSYINHVRDVLDNRIDRLNYTVQGLLDDHHGVRFRNFPNPGGWITIQKRSTGGVNFNRRWQDYKRGFGSRRTDYWMGLDRIHDLTMNGAQLKIKLRYNGRTKFAYYSYFKVGGEHTNYKLFVHGYKRAQSNAGDCLTQDQNLDGMEFSTRDRDHDTSAYSCATDRRSGGWWYAHCGDSALNGKWDVHRSRRGIFWKDFTGSNSAEYVEMFVRPHH